jgi:hypothetical protein
MYEIKKYYRSNNLFGKILVNPKITPKQPVIEGK